MTEDVTLRRAGVDDGGVVAALWVRSAKWLKARGSDQWQYPVRMGNIAAAIAAGSCWLASRDGSVIGTITLDDNADPVCWFPDDDPANALYVHRMVVDDGEHGYELGSAMLDWAGARCVLAGRKWLRLDAWRSNKALHQYYLAREFEHVRTVEHPNGAGVCFQRPAIVRLRKGPRIVTAEEA